MSALRPFVSLLVLSAASLLGCQQAQPEASAVDAATQLVDAADMATPWTGVLQLVEDLRIGGLGAEPAFGALEDLAVHPDGGVVVFDIQAGQLYRFGPDGALVGPIGRSGQGPGEYDGVNGLAVSPIGEVYVRSMDGRFLVFDSDGSLLRSWRLPTRLMHERKLTIDVDGHLVVQETLVPPDRPFQIAGRGFIRLLPTGEVVDTLGPFATPWDAEAVSTHPTHPRKHLEWSPRAFAIGGVSSRLGFGLTSPGSPTRNVERPYVPLEYPSAEYDQWVRHAEWLKTRVASPDLVNTPSPTKPAYVRLLPGPSGRIWVQRSAASVEPAPGWVAEAHGAPRTPEWLSPVEFSVFDQDGAFLGELSGPMGFQPKAVAGHSVWGYAKGDFGETYIVRLSIE